MHPCLQIPELLQEVLNLCEGRDVLYMCLTCRTFTSAALDVLWRDLRVGIAPITYCFPTGIMQSQVEENAAGLRKTTISIRRSPAPGDWERVYANSHRVRALRLQITGPVHPFYVSEDIYRLFINHCLISDVNLFPNLRGLSCNVANNTLWGTATAHLLAESLARSHPLEWFHYFERDSVNTIDLVKCLRVSADTLKSLHMSIRPPTLDSRPEIVSKAVGQLRALENAEFGSPITSTTLSHLAGLPKLTSLVLDFGHRSMFPDPQLLEPGPSHFAALRTLHVTITLDRQLTSVLALFDNIVPDRLQNLTVKFEWLPAVDDLTKLIHCIGRARSLRALDMYCSVPGAYKGDYVPAPGDELRWPVPCTMLYPLLGLRSLESLDLTALPLVVQPDDIATFAAAWPDLKVLHLSANDILTKTTVSLSGLLPLIAGCPSLERLQIQLREGGGSIAESTTARSVRNVVVALQDPFPDDDDSDSSDGAVPEQWQALSEQWQARRLGWLRRLSAVFPHAEVETKLVAVGPFWL